MRKVWANALEWLRKNWRRELTFWALGVAVTLLWLLVQSAPGILADAKAALAAVRPSAIAERYAAELKACRYRNDGAVDCAPPLVIPASSDVAANPDPLGRCGTPFGMSPTAACHCERSPLLPPNTVCKVPLAPDEAVDCCTVPQEQAPQPEPAPPEIYSVPWIPAVAMRRTAGTLVSETPLSLVVFLAAAVIAVLLSAIAVVLALERFGRNLLWPAALAAIIVFPFTTTLAAWLLLAAFAALAWLIGGVVSVLLAVWAMLRAPFELYEALRRLREFGKLTNEASQFFRRGE